MPNGHDDTERLLERAADSGKKVADIAETVLVEAGFDIVKAGVVRRDLGAHFSFLVTDKAVGRQWYVEVSGAFTTARPGMRRADALWKTLGRAHVLASGHAGDAPEDRPRLLVLTPRLPRRGSEGDRAMRATGGSGFFDAVEMFDDAAVERLHHYAQYAPDRPLSGFWDEDEIALHFA